MAGVPVGICDIHGPDEEVGPAMTVVSSVVAEQHGGLRPRPAERELAARRTPDPTAQSTLFLVGAPGAPDGVAQVSLELESNVHAASAHVWVPEDRRRRGIGSALLVAASGQRRLTYLAVHRATGQGAGFTTVRWDPEEPVVLWQRGTAVAADHRGHRLGRRLKAAMLQHLLATVDGAREVRTENAGTNAHMLAINDALGFAPWAEQVLLQKHL